MKLISILGYAILVGVLVGLYFQGSLLASNFAAITVQILSVLLMIWARIAFGWRSFHAAANPTQGGLVTTGPYRFIRHPIYASILYFIWAAVLSHLSLTNVLLGVVTIAAVSFRIYTEEKLIVTQYPEYIAYAAKTKRIFPYIV